MRNGPRHGANETAYGMTLFRSQPGPTHLTIHWQLRLVNRYQVTLLLQDLRMNMRSNDPHEDTPLAWEEVGAHTTSEKGTSTPKALVPMTLSEDQLALALDLVVGCIRPLTILSLADRVVMVGMIPVRRLGQDMILLVRAIHLVATRDLSVATIADLAEVLADLEVDSVATSFELGRRL